MRTLFSVLAIAFVGVAATSCSTQPAASVLRGHIQQATFPAPVGQITVVDATGASTTVPVDKNGAFKASLSAGGTYHLFLSADGKSTPLVVHANLDASIVVKSGGATVDVGGVRIGLRLRRVRSTPPSSPARADRRRRSAREARTTATARRPMTRAGTARAGPTA